MLQEAPPKEGDPPDKVMVELIVCDTGKVNVFDLIYVHPPMFLL